MREFGPRALTPYDGRHWLLLALQLMWRHPWLFIAVALIPPTCSAVLLELPFWEWWLPPDNGWAILLATVFCYGMPLSFTVTLACGLARAANRKRFPAPHQLFNVTALKALARTSFILFVLLLQGYLTAYLLRNQLLPQADSQTLYNPSVTLAFGVTSTVLGTQISVLGGLLVALQILLAVFIVPLQLFREFPLAVCWLHSALAIQLNPWLFPIQGLTGLTLLILPFFEVFSIPAQMLALPLPVYMGALLYVAWNDVFQGGVEEEAIVVLHDQWRTDVNGEPVSR